MIKLTRVEEELSEKIQKLIEKKNKEYQDALEMAEESGFGRPEAPTVTVGEGDINIVVSPLYLWPEDIRQIFVEDTGVHIKTSCGDVFVVEESPLAVFNKIKKYEWPKK